MDENVIEVNIARLRKNMAQTEADGLLETVRGQGYRLRGLDE